MIESYDFIYNGDNFHVMLIDGLLTDIFQVTGRCYITLIHTDEIVNAFKDFFMAIKK